MEEGNKRPLTGGTEFRAARFAMDAAKQMELPQTQVEAAGAAAIGHVIAEIELSSSGHKRR